MRKQILRNILNWFNNRKSNQSSQREENAGNYLVKHTGLNRADRRAIDAQISSGNLPKKIEENYKKMYIQSDFNDPYENPERAKKKLARKDRLSRRAVFRAGKKTPYNDYSFAGRGIVQRNGFLVRPMIVSPMVY